MNEPIPDDDHSAAIPLEINQETAERAEEVLRLFAEDAEMDMALIVDRSGALIAGIAADAEVPVDTISALVAGVCGAVDALIDKIGESGEIESFHSGGERQLYLRELENRFILVGVSGVDLPTGIIREKSAQIRGELSEILQEIQARSATIAKRRRSLHSIVPGQGSEEEADTSEQEETIIEEELIVSEKVEEVTVREEVEEKPEDIVLETPEVDEPLISLDAAGESPFSLDSETEPTTKGAGIRFDDLSGLTDPLEAEDEISAIETVNIDEVEDSTQEEVPEEVEGITEEEVAEALPAPEPPVAPPVLVAPVVLDSPFEAVEDDDENELGIVSDETEEEVKLPSQPGPSIGKAQEAENDCIIPLPPPVAEQEELEEEEPEERKSGPRYSFELG